MKIAAVETFQLRGEGEQGGYGSPYGFVVKVVTEDGIVGYGETDSMPPVVEAIVHAPFLNEMMSGLAAVILGNDADSAASWDRMSMAALGYSRDGGVRHAMAAIDIALWDIKGKAEGKPVCALLGGAKRERLRAYATHPLGLTLRETASFAEMLIEDGFSAVKFGWRPLGPDPDGDEAIVRTLREAIGPEADLLIDGGMAWDLEAAKLRAARFAPYRPYWLEEPLPAYDFDAYAELRASSPVRIAAGEMSASYAELQHLVKRRGVDVLQVDVSRTGLTEAMRIAGLAAQYGIPCVNHTYSYLFNAAASLHFAAAVEITDLFECQVTPNGLRDALDGGQLRPRDGWAFVPTAPGLGVEVDEAVLRRFRVPI
ncbi:MAG: mandelate racemase/muconate lactonizing enzyme family protein [Rhizobiales bacterium]|nr:mandelate racemase/muconate lactonizing enzyme family protein [Hyphomicrobiales bacterium]